MQGVQQAVEEARLKDQEDAERRKAEYLQETNGDDSRDALDLLLLKRDRGYLTKVLPADMTVTGYAECRKAHTEAELEPVADRIRLCAMCPSHGGGCARDQSVTGLVIGHEPVYNAEWHALESRECGKWPEWQMWQSLARAGFAAPERAREFSSYQPQTEGQARAKAWCEAYVRDFPWPYRARRPGTVIFEGPFGTGKRHLATQMLQLLHRHYYEHRFRTRILSMVEICSLLSDRNEEYKREEVVALLSKLPILLIEKIDAKEASDKSARQYLDLIAGNRRQHALPIIVTTEAPVTALEHIVGSGFASYIKERATRVLLDGPNYQDTQMLTVGATPIDDKRSN